MLNLLLVIIHHPLAALAFAIWHFFAWSEHGTAVFHSALKSAGFHEDDFTAFNKAWHISDDDATPSEAADEEPLVKAQVAPEVVVMTTTDSPKTTQVPTPTPPYSECAGDEDHLGKWRRGDDDLKLHYVCETKASNHESYQECPDSWQVFQGKSGRHCYMADLIWPVQYDKAEQACRSMNSALVVIESQAENEFVQELVGRNSVWLGLSMQQSNWTWSTGAPFSYANWDKLQSATYHTSRQVVYMNYWKALCMPPPWWINGIPVAMDFMLQIAFGVFVALMLTLVCVLTFVPCCFACVYKQKVSDKRAAIPGLVEAEQRAPTRHTFESQLCGCLQDMDVFWHACCCNITRVADTHHAAGTMKFWHVFLWWIGSAFAGGILGGGSGLGKLIAGVIIAVVMTHKRQELKAKLGIVKGSSFEDFMLWWCCSLCAAAQEAREIDNAAGVAVKCCCSLKRRHPSPESMVGAPVAAGPASLAEPLQASPQITVVNLPAATPHPTQHAMTHQNPLPTVPPRAASHTSMVSMQEINAAQPAPPQMPQPTIAQVVSITPPGGHPTHIVQYS